MGTVLQVLFSKISLITFMLVTSIYTWRWRKRKLLIKEPFR